MADEVQVFDGGKSIDRAKERFTKNGSMVLKVDSDGLMATVRRAKLKIKGLEDIDISWEEAEYVEDKLLMNELSFVKLKGDVTVNLKDVVAIIPYETREANEEIKKEYGHLIEGWYFDIGNEPHHKGLRWFCGRPGSASYSQNTEEEDRNAKSLDELKPTVEVFYVDKTITEIKVGWAKNRRVIWRLNEI